MFKVLSSKLKFISSLNKPTLDNFRILSGTTLKNFSSGHHSNSDSDLDHGHHSSTSSNSSSETEDHLSLLRKRAFSKIPKKFSVDEILAKSNTPITKATEQENIKALFASEEEYISFLAKEFEKKAELKYPGYKSDISSFKHKIFNYDRLNPYQKEVQTLNVYLLNKLDIEREELTKAFQGDLNGTPLEQAKSRLNLMQSKLIYKHILLIYLLYK